MDDQVYTGINILEYIKWRSIYLIKEEIGVAGVVDVTLKMRSKIITGIGILE